MGGGRHAKALGCVGVRAVHCPWPDIRLILRKWGGPGATHDLPRGTENSEFDASNGEGALLILPCLGRGPWIPTGAVRQPGYEGVAVRGRGWQRHPRRRCMVRRGMRGR